MPPDYTGKPCKGCTGKKSPSVDKELYCLKCKRARRAASKAKAHESRVGKVYGLEPGDYARLYAAQGGKCALCQRSTGASKRLAVDHIHSIEELGRVSVRGLACGPCNIIIGHARDDPEFFLRTYHYLISPPAWGVFATEAEATAALKARVEGLWL